MVRSAYVYNLVKSAGEFGVSARDVLVDWSKVIDRKDRIVRELEVAKQSSLEERGIEVVRGRAAFRSPREVAVNGQVVRADKVILAADALG